MTQVSHHAANLTIPPLVQLHVQMAAIPVALDKPQAHGAGPRRPAPPPIVQEDPSLQRLDAGRIERALDDHLVFLVDAVARVCQSVGEISIVGQQQQSGGVGVQAADAEQARSAGVEDQIDRSCSSFGITVGTHHVARFVEHDVDAVSEPGA